MSKSNDVEKLLFVLEKINDAIEYKNSFSSIEELLNSKMGFDAVSMCILQVGETLNKLSKTTIQNYPSLPIKESYLTRNYIAHDYEGIDKMILETILREYFPKLKDDIEKILREIS